MKRKYSEYSKEAKLIVRKTFENKFNYIKYYFHVLISFFGSLIFFLIPILWLSNNRKARYMREKQNIDLPKLFQSGDTRKTYFTSLISIVMIALYFLAGFLLITICGGLIFAVGYAISWYANENAIIITIMVVFAIPLAFSLIAYLILFPIYMAPIPYIIDQYNEVRSSDAIKASYLLMTRGGKGQIFVRKLLNYLKDLLVLAILAALVFLTIQIFGSVYIPIVVASIGLFVALIFIARFNAKASVANFILFKDLFDITDLIDNRLIINAQDKNGLEGFDELLLGLFDRTRDQNPDVIYDFKGLKVPQESPEEKIEAIEAVEDDSPVLIEKEISSIENLDENESVESEEVEDEKQVEITDEKEESLDVVSPSKPLEETNSKKTKSKTTKPNIFNHVLIILGNFFKDLFNINKNKVEIIDDEALEASKMDLFFDEDMDNVFDKVPYGKVNDIEISQNLSNDINQDNPDIKEEMVDEPIEESNLDVQEENLEKVEEKNKKSIFKDLGSKLGSIFKHDKKKDSNKNSIDTFSQEEVEALKEEPTAIEEAFEAPDAQDAKIETEDVSKEEVKLEAENQISEESKEDIDNEDVLDQIDESSDGGLEEDLEDELAKREELQKFLESEETNNKNEDSKEENNDNLAETSDEESNSSQDN